jgi:RimJ/RimL family protein N-acetyltransferase
MMSPSISARLASWPAFLVPGSAQLRVQQAVAAREAGLALPLAVTRRIDDSVLGWISASRAEAEPRRALLTYWIGEAFQGQGIMREAAPVALEATFRTLGVTEVRAAVQSDNAASRSVLRALGMRPLGPGRIWCSARGREEPCEWWSILRHDVPASVMAAAFLPAPRAAVAAR